MKKGLVLEGGAMRGLWTAGVTDVMMEHGVWPDGLIGVSAGAAFGCNIKSRQIGRAIRYNTRFAKDARYSGIRSWLTTGDYFNAQFGYHVVPYEYDLFDTKAFEENKVVEVQGYRLLDGGVADSIPLSYFEQHGYDRNVVILTQPKGFVKERNTLMPLMRVGLRKYPNMIKAMDERHLMYNNELEYVAQAEQEGRCLVIRPDGKIPIGHISHAPDEMHHVYELGRQVGERYIDRIKDFYAL